MGRLWFDHVEPLKQMFIDSGMPEDFLEKLSVAIAEVQRTIDDRTFSIGRAWRPRSRSRTRGAALSALQRLDPIMCNLIGDDPPAVCRVGACGRRRGTEFQFEAC